MLRLQTSLNRRGFPCPRCARTFHTSGGMSRHYRLECVDLPRFKCPHCDMRSKYTQAVYRHIRAKHRNMELRFVKLYWENKKKRDGERNNNNNPRYNVYASSPPFVRPPRANQFFAFFSLSPPRATRTDTQGSLKDAVRSLRTFLLPFQRREEQFERETEREREWERVEIVDRGECIESLTIKESAFGRVVLSLRLYSSGDYFEVKRESK